MVRALVNVGAREYTDKVGADDTDGLDMAYRVVADHIRTLSFAIADGAAPGNEGRDYVLRRVLRRAVRYGDKLGGKLGFFSELVRPLVAQMGSAYPELVAKEDHIRSVRSPSLHWPGHLVIMCYMNRALPKEHPLCRAAFRRNAAEYKTGVHAT